MKKEIVYVKQKVVINYETKEQRKEVLNSLRNSPDSIAVISQYWHWEKKTQPPTFMFPKKKK